MSARSRRGESSLRVDPRTGFYIWRRHDPRTGKRRTRSTRTANLRVATRKAREFDDELEADLLGRRRPADVWRLEVAPLIEKHVAELDWSDSSKRQRKSELDRACARLGIILVGHLDAATLNEKLLAAIDAGELPRMTARRNVQVPLKKFSAWLAENGRFLEHAPLGNWKLIRAEVTLRRRALLPELAARAFLAVELLDEFHRREPLAVVYRVLLVGAPRAGALISRDVAHLDRKRSRIDLGAGSGRKLRGACALDPRTLRDVARYLGRRRSGPLFLSPKGKRLTAKRLLADWREAVGLAVVDDLWDATREARDFELEWLVAYYLRSDRAIAARGGRTPTKAKTKRRQDERLERIVAIGDELRESYDAAMEGVDVHALRMTHETWARVAGVNPVTIDEQLGHVGRGTGRRHYTDAAVALFNPEDSAAAVRARLEEGRTRVVSSRAFGLAPSVLRRRRKGDRA